MSRNVPVTGSDEKRLYPQGPRQIYNADAWQLGRVPNVLRNSTSDHKTTKSGHKMPNQVKTD